MGVIKILDCTLRDGAYICDSKFGTAAIRGIISKSEEANIDIIECGWLKDKEHEKGTTFYHVPSDLKQYVAEKKRYCVYAVMIDWNRYNLDTLPINDGKSIDAIRVVFPHEKYHEGVEVGKKIKEKGYKVFFQAANTLAYTDEELVDLADTVNRTGVQTLSIVDTFGAMYQEDLSRIVSVLDKYLDTNISLGFHSHNNQQLSFALSIYFINIMNDSKRDIVVDASLCGMGRGAGNATTELIAHYINTKHHGNYDMNSIMDSIDTYMGYFQENYRWGYSIPYFIAGMYQCHVNNITYLLKNHRTNAKDMRNIIQSMSVYDRRRYDYDYLEKKYIENQIRAIDDEQAFKELEKALGNKEILLIAPGIGSTTCSEKINQYIKEHDLIIIHVNALNNLYRADYLFLISPIRYDYAKLQFAEEFAKAKKIVLSSIKNEAAEGEYLINYSRVVKTGWEYFDNAVIDCLRLLDKLHVKKVSITGFDAFKTNYNETYGDKSLPTISLEGKAGLINKEITEMFADFEKSSRKDMEINFVTENGFK